MIMHKTVSFINFGELSLKAHAVLSYVTVYATLVYVNGLKKNRRFYSCKGDCNIDPLVSMHVKTVKHACSHGEQKIPGRQRASLQLGFDYCCIFQPGKFTCRLHARWSAPVSLCWCACAISIKDCLSHLYCSVPWTDWNLNLSAVCTW